MSVKPVLSGFPALLGLRLLRAGPAAGHTGESLARAVVRGGLGCPEDRALDGRRRDQLAPRDPPVLALGGLLVVDQPPHLIEDLLRQEAGDQAPDDAERREEDATHGRSVLPRECPG